MANALVNKMKIAHISATFPPYQGGTGNVCYHNARQLARLGHELHVFTASLPKAATREERDGFIVHRLSPLVQVGNAPLLPQLLCRLRDFDVIHLHYPFFGGEFCVLAAAINRIPLVITYHQDVILTGVMGMAARFLEATVGRWTFSVAKKVLFTSHDYGQAGKGRPIMRPETIDELPNGVDSEYFTPTGPRASLFKDQTAPIALLVASLDQAHYFKGVSIFLEALARLPALRAVIVGDGDLRSSYETTAQQLGLSERLDFAGRVSNTDLGAYYRRADVTVLPSTTMGEAFGLVLVESLACGTPVIASNLPGVRTVVADGQDGFLVEPGNVSDLAAKLTALLSLPATERHQMGLAGRCKVKERYAWERIGVRLEKIYRQVVTSPTIGMVKRVSEN